MRGKGVPHVDATALDSIPLFADLTEQERAEVAATLRDVTVDAGANITVQGDNAWQLFVIESGEAEVRRDGEVVRTVGPGDVLGEIGLLATGTRTASVVATSPMRLGAMFLRDFKQLETRVPALAKSLRTAMADRPWVT
jgi:CRP/FNR family transcriptional regulator, cyclic AMP receptor protein